MTIFEVVDVFYCFVFLTFFCFFSFVSTQNLCSNLATGYVCSLLPTPHTVPMSPWIPHPTTHTAHTALGVPPTDVMKKILPK